MILIFSILNDISTNWVIEKLRQRNFDVLRINFDDDQYRLHYLDKDQIIFRHKSGQEYDLTKATAFWYRKGGLNYHHFGYYLDRIKDYPFFKQEIGPEFLKDYLNRQKKALADFIFNKLEQTCPITLGSYFNSGLNRLSTLEKASFYGLKVPDYHIISDSGQLLELGAAQGYDLVSKSVEDGIYAFVKDRRYYTYTEEIIPVDYQGYDIDLASSLVMEKITKKYEIRSFFLGNTFYSMAIFSQKNAQTSVDFRKYSKEKPNRQEPYQLPGDISDKLRNVFSDYRLNTGSVDLIVDESGEYVFLEINPVGQFGMVSVPCQYSLEDKVADYLTGK